MSKARMNERKREDRAVVKPNSIDVKPRYPLGILYPDGRVRLPDMTLVLPIQCDKVTPYKL